MTRLRPPSTMPKATGRPSAPILVATHPMRSGSAIAEVFPDHFEPPRLGRGRDKRLRGLPVLG